jgi:hypothetical protein
MLPEGARIRHGMGSTTLHNSRVTRNKRSVWAVNTEPNKHAHFATFPTKLIEPMILAGCPEKMCSKCGAAWIREIETTGGTIGKGWTDHQNDLTMGMSQAPDGLDSSLDENGNPYQRIDKGFRPDCDCNADTIPGVIYDPFMGSGTTALVARQHGRDYIGSELNPEYVAIAQERLRLPFEPHVVTKADKPIPRPTVQVGDITLEQQVMFDE